MPLNDEKDEGNKNQSDTPRILQDELTHVIHTSFNNIATQVNNLNKYAEDLFGELFKEVDKACLKCQVLQERVIQLTDGVHKNPKEGLSLQTMKSKKTFGSKTDEAQQVYSCKPFPGMQYETHDASVQTMPLNIHASYHECDTRTLKIFPDASHSFELHKEKIILENKEQKKRKLKHKKKHVAPNRPDSEPKYRPMEADVSVNHIPTASGKVSHSYMGKPTISSSISTLPVNEISKLLTRAVGKVFSSPLHLPKHGAGDQKNSFTCISYGTGVGEELQYQSQPPLKTEVFVSPTVPDSPPLPSDWLSLLRTPKKENLPPIGHFPTQLPLPVLRTPAAKSPLDCLHTSSLSALPITPPKVHFSPLARQPFKCNKIAPDYLTPQGEDQEMHPPLSSSVTAPNIQIKGKVTDIFDSTSIVQSPRLSVFQSSKFSLTQSPRSLVAKSPRSSEISTSRPSLPSARHSIASLPRSPVPQTSQSSFPQSLASSCPQATEHLILSPRDSVAQVPRCSVALSLRHLDAQSPTYSLEQLSRDSVSQLSRTTDAESQRPSIAQSTGHLTPAQSTLSNLKSSKSFMLRSLFSFVQSPSSCISNIQAPPVSQSSTAPVSHGLKQSPSTMPKDTKRSNAFMEAIRKGILSHKTKDYCVSKLKMEIPENETSFVPDHGKAMGNSSSKPDSEVDWMNENK